VIKTIFFYKKILFEQKPHFYVKNNALRALLTLKISLKPLKALGATRNSRYNSVAMNINDMWKEFNYGRYE